MTIILFMTIYFKIMPTSLLQLVLPAPA
jgi:hypothetical protein